MEIRNLNTFLQVVESGSFTRAAEILGYTQSTVSFQINQLEEELGCQLFDRIGHNIFLTNRGELLQARALEIINSMEYLKDEFRKEEAPVGQVHMYSSDSICEKMMLGNYKLFSGKYPDINLIFSTGSTTDLFAVLERNEADIIFTLDNHAYKHNLVVAKESPVRVVFVTNPDSPLAAKSRVTMEDIATQPLLLTESGTSYRKLLDDIFAKHSIAINPILETGRTDILVKCIRNGGGVSFLPEFIVKDEVKKGRLVILDVEGVDLTIWKQLIYRKDKWVSKAMRAFLDFVMENEFKW